MRSPRYEHRRSCSPGPTGKSLASPLARASSMTRLYPIPPIRLEPCANVPPPPPPRPPPLPPPRPPPPRPAMLPALLCFWSAGRPRCFALVTSFAMTNGWSGAGTAKGKRCSSRPTPKLKGDTTCTSEALQARRSAKCIAWTSAPLHAEIDDDR